LKRTHLDPSLLYQIYILFMLKSIYPDNTQILTGINTGSVYRYITKPWNREELKMNIDKGLETYQLREQNRKLIADLKEANQTLECSTILK